MFYLGLSNSGESRVTGAVEVALAPMGQALAQVPPSESQARSGALQLLCTIARLHQIAADPETLAHQLGLQPSEPVGTNELLRVAKHLGLKAKLTTTTAERLQLCPLPALAVMRQDNG